MDGIRQPRVGVVCTTAGRGCVGVLEGQRVGEDDGCKGRRMLLFSKKVAKKLLSGWGIYGVKLSKSIRVVGVGS